MSLWIAVIMFASFTAAAAIICTVAYEYIVPNNIVWAVVVPIAFITFQSGEVPGFFNMETWLILYFGLYKKCWADVAMVLSLFCF